MRKELPMDFCLKTSSSGAVPETLARMAIRQEAEILAVSLIASFASNNSLSGQELFNESKRVAEMIWTRFEGMRREFTL